MRQMRKERNILDFEVISGKHYWGGGCVTEIETGALWMCVYREGGRGGGVWMWV